RLSNDCSRVIPPVQKSLNGLLWSSRPSGNLGKADVTGEETGERTLSATVVGVQGSEDRSADDQSLPTQGPSRPFLRHRPGQHGKGQRPPGDLTVDGLDRPPLSRRPHSNLRS